MIFKSSHHKIILNLNYLMYSKMAYKYNQQNKNIRSVTFVHKFGQSGGS